MEVAITGASGLIGGALVEALRDGGHRPVPLVRRAVRPGEDAITWDPTARTIDRASLEGLDGVVHLAGAGIGEHRWTDGYKALVLTSRTRTTSLLAEALASLDRPPPVLVSGSAVGYYGDRGDDVLTERSGPGSSFLADVVVRWESAAQPAADAGIRVALARTSMVLSPAGGALVPLLRLFKLGLGGRMGSGRQWWSWITLDDEVRALRFLLERPVSGPANLAAPQPVTNAGFTRVLARVLRRPALVPVPSFAPKLLKGAELAQELLFSSQRVVPAVLEAEGFAFGHPHLEGALRSVLAR
jgi:uncharacterized protein (TIGR01777 family)